MTAPEVSRDPAKYLTEPLVVPVVSGYLPERERVRSGLYAPASPAGREPRVPVPSRDIVCYECGKHSRIPDAALSAHCVHCRAHLNAADVVLKPGSRRLTIRTLGDVKVPAQVSLSHLSVLCRNMEVSGRAAGSLHCTGALTLRGQAVVEGQVQAAVVEVVSGAQATCSPALASETAQIDGQLTGRLYCNASIYISRGGRLIGDCRAEMLSIDPGGRHEGTWERIRV